MHPQVRTLLEGRFSGRKVLLAAEVLAQASARASLLRDLGADVRAIAPIKGIGEIPDVPHRLWGGTESPESIMSGIWEFERVAQHPPKEIRAWIDAWDPGHEALVFTLTPGWLPHVAGRPIYGNPRREWKDLEDKTVIDAVWDAAHVPRVPSEVVPVSDAPDAHRALGGNTVWAADNRDGWHGGGARTRWAPTEQHAERLAEFFAPIADTVRVMPFMEGLPCSIHGFVTDGKVQTFRPVEMLILRNRVEGTFFYASVATTWDPAPADRAEMRAIAARVGWLLHETVAYRGGFSIDGVMTVDGFRPTELNPRLSAGLALQLTSVIDDLPVGTLTDLLIAGDLPAGMLDDLEERVVQAADEQRVGRVTMHAHGDVPEGELPVRFRDGTLEDCDADAAEAVIRVGRGPGGTTVMARFEHVEPGYSFAPRVLAVVQFLRDELGMDFPELEAPVDVRAR